MDNNITIRRYEVDGLKVKIEQGDDKYSVRVVFPRKAIQDNRFLFQSDKITVDLIFKCMPSTNFIEIEYQKGYNMAKYGLIRVKPSVQKISEEFCKGTITIQPKIYIPKSRRATQKKLKEKANAMKGLKNYGPLRDEYRPSGSKYTPYKNNNAFRPYSGGLMQPK